MDGLFVAFIPSEILAEENTEVSGFISFEQMLSSEALSGDP